MTQLRPYQEDAVSRLRTAYAAGARAPLLVLPTGGGKTVVFAHICEGVSARGRRACVLVHRRELIHQASAKLHAAGVPHGIVAPGHTPTRDAIQVASVQTLGRRIGRGATPRPFDLLVIDEAHHACAGQWMGAIAAFPAARLLGVTATPERLDGKGLGRAAGGPFDAIIEGPGMADLIRDGFLVPVEAYAPPGTADTGGIATRAGDWARDQLATAVDRPTITGSAVEHYGRLSPGLPAIAFCVSVEHAKHVATEFRAAGWRAAAADGAMDPRARDAAIAGLGTGAVQVLTSCDLISEGLDVPAVGAVILLRPTKSLGLHLQQIGRGLRPAAGKGHLIVLDHAGNILRHGLPDEPRQWSLEGAARRPRADKPLLPAILRCPACFALHTRRAVCPQCGHVHATAGGREVEHADGELVHIDAAARERLRQAPLRELLAGARTPDQLREIAKARGYKPGWAWHVLRERRSRGEVAA